MLGGLWVSDGGGGGGGGGSTSLITSLSEQITFGWGVCGVTNGMISLVTSGVAASLGQIGAGAAFVLLENLGWVDSPTSSTINTSNGYQMSAQTASAPGLNPQMDILMRTHDTLANVRFWIGLFDGAPLGTSDTAPAANCIGFRYSTAVPDAGWIGCMRAASGAIQTTASLGALATNTQYRLRLRVDSGAGITYFRVNDAAEVALATGMPAVGTGFRVSLQLTNIAAGLAKNAYWQRAILAQPGPL